MASINLLPWRRELREQRKREFLIILGGAVALSAILVLYAHTHVESMISYQNDRNAYLDREIQAVNVKIAQIRELEKTKTALLARMNIIQELQRSRPEIVHMFDELAKTVPDGVYLTRVSHKGTALTVEGVAQSNARVSAYMNNLDSSPWLTDPKLRVIETKGNNLNINERRSYFTLEVKQVVPKTEDEQKS